MPDKLEKRIEHLEELRDELENLISLAAQTSDKTSINLTTKVEAFEKTQQVKDEKRWSSFKWAVGAAIFLMTVIVPINFLYMERLNNQVFINSQRISVLETNDKGQPSFAEIEKLKLDTSKRESEMRESIKINTERLNHVVTQTELSQLRKEIIDMYLHHSKEQHGK
jgi:hypothetical protein